MGVDRRHIGTWKARVGGEANDVLAYGTYSLLTPEHVQSTGLPVVEGIAGVVDS